MLASDGETDPRRRSVLLSSASSHLAVIIEAANGGDASRRAEASSIIGDFAANGVTSELLTLAEFDALVANAEAASGAEYGPLRAAAATLAEHLPTPAYRISATLRLGYLSADRPDGLGCATAVRAVDALLAAAVPTGTIDAATHRGLTDASGKLARRCAPQP